MRAILALLVTVGWVLGIVGFFRARRAERSLAALRSQVERLLAASRPAAAPAQRVAVAPPASGSASKEPEPVPVQLPVDAAPSPPQRDLESLLTQRWSIWIGAAALSLSGVFLIRYAADNGLLGPAARCALAGLLGAGRLGGATWLRRGADTGAAPAALAAGGVAVLFGAAYGAGPFYGLLPPLAGFALMAMAAAIGMLASLRFGLPVAVIGVAGAFATPALVATASPTLPGLFAYLLIVTAAPSGWCA